MYDQHTANGTGSQRAFPLAPTPLETINGSKPNIIVRAVIKIGRRRTFAALRAPSQAHAGQAALGSVLRQ